MAWSLLLLPAQAWLRRQHRKVARVQVLGTAVLRIAVETVVQMAMNVASSAQQLHLESLMYHRKSRRLQLLLRLPSRFGAWP